MRSHAFSQVSRTGITFGAENAGTGDTSVMGKLMQVRAHDMPSPVFGFPRMLRISTGSVGESRIARHQLLLYDTSVLCTSDPTLLWLFHFVD